MEIKSERIIIKRVTESDLDFVCRVESDKELWKYSSSVETDCERIKKKFTERMKSDGAYDFILLMNNEERTPIGLIYIWDYIKERSSFEIGYVVTAQFQGKGYCAEALKHLLEFAFGELKAHKVVAMCNEYNAASYKAMEKAGMTREGVFRKEYIHDGEWVNQYFYCILEEEYFKNK